MTTAVVNRPASSAPLNAIPSGTPLLRLVGVEWRKTTGTRAARWVLLAAALVTVGVLAIPMSFPADIGQTLAEYLDFAGTGLSILLPVVLILTVTSEWSQRTALATFTQEPRRARVLTAKLVVGALVSIGASVIGVGLASAGVLLSGGIGRDVAWTVPWQAVLGLLGFTVLNVALGMAFGVLLHNSAAAIVLFYIQGVLWGVLGGLGPVQNVANWLDPNRAMTYVQSAEWSGRWPEIATALAVWVALPLVAGVVRTLRRDVN